MKGMADSLGDLGWPVEDRILGESCCCREMKHRRRPWWGGGAEMPEVGKGRRDARGREGAPGMLLRAMGGAGAEGWLCHHNKEAALPPS